MLSLAAISLLNAVEGKTNDPFFFMKMNLAGTVSAVKIGHEGGAQKHESYKIRLTGFFMIFSNQVSEVLDRGFEIEIAGLYNP